MVHESRIDKRTKAAMLVTLYALTGWSYTTTKWAARRVNRTRRWWGF